MVPIIACVILIIMAIAALIYSKSDYNKKQLDRLQKH